MAEFAKQCFPDRHVASITGFRVLKGIVIEGAERTVRLVLALPPRVPDECGTLRTDVEIRGSDGRCTVVPRD